MSESKDLFSSLGDIFTDIGSLMSGQPARSKPLGGASKIISGLSELAQWHTEITEVTVKAVPPAAPEAVVAPVAKRAVPTPDVNSKADALRDRLRKAAKPAAEPQCVITLNGWDFEFDGPPSLSIVGDKVFLNGEPVDLESSDILQVEITKGSIGTIFSTADVSANVVYGQVVVNGDVSVGSVVGNIAINGNLSASNITGDIDIEGDLNGSIINGEIRDK